MPRVTQEGLYIENGRVLVYWRDRFGRMRTNHMAYIDADGAVTFAKPNIGVKIPLGRQEDNKLVLDLS